MHESLQVVPSHRYPMIIIVVFTNGDFHKKQDVLLVKEQCLSYHQMCHNEPQSSW